MAEDVIDVDQLRLIPAMLDGAERDWSYVEVHAVCSVRACRLGREEIRQGAITDPVEIAGVLYAGLDALAPVALV